MADICFSSAYRETRPSQEVSSKCKIPSWHNLQCYLPSSGADLHLGRFWAPFMGWRRGGSSMLSTLQGQMYACGRNNSQREWVQIPALPQIDRVVQGRVFYLQKVFLVSPVTGPAFPVLQAVNRNKCTHPHM